MPVLVLLFEDTPISKPALELLHPIITIVFEFDVLIHVIVARLSLYFYHRFGEYHLFADHSSDNNRIPVYHCHFRADIQQYAEVLFGCNQNFRHFEVSPMLLACLVLFQSGFIDILELCQHYIFKILLDICQAILFVYSNFNHSKLAYPCVQLSFRNILCLYYLRRLHLTPVGIL